MDVDSRPTADLGDYRVHVRGASRSVSTNYALQWGVATPTIPATTERLSVDLEVEARSRQAALLVAGLDPSFEVTLDGGETLTADIPGLKGSRFRYASLFRSWRGEVTSSDATDVELGGVPVQTGALKRLAGKLWLYPEVKSCEVRIEPGSQGSTIRQEGFAISVDTWEQLGDATQVRLTLSETPIPWDPTTCWRSAKLVCKDGYTDRMEGPGGPKAVAKSQWEFLFRQLTSDPAYLELRIVQRPPADRTVDFEIEGIPLP
jgi:hypothetical protein